MLPFKIETEGLVEKGCMIGFKDLKGKETITDIKYNVDIDESLFEPNIPDDYRLINAIGFSSQWHDYSCDFGYATELS